jgi:hypothetical protein
LIGHGRELPALRDDLHAPVASLQWTVSAYNL